MSIGHCVFAPNKKSTSGIGENRDQQLAMWTLAEAGSSEESNQSFCCLKKKQYSTRQQLIL